MVDDYCKGCYYRIYIPGADCYGCEYLVITEKRRPCPSGEGCTVRRLKDRAGTHNADQRKKALALEGMTEEELRERYLAKKRERNQKYYAKHKTEVNKRAAEKRRIKRPAETKGAHSKKKITALNTKAYWKGRQSEAIKSWKLEHGMTYEQMAELLEVEPSTVVMWAYERNTANWDKLRKIGIEKPYIPPEGTIDKSLNIYKNDSGGLDERIAEN